MSEVYLAHFQALHTRRLSLIANCTQLYDWITPYASPRCNSSCLHRGRSSQGDCRAARRVARHDVYVATKRKGTKNVVKTNEEDTRRLSLRQRYLSAKQDLGTQVKIFSLSLHKLRVRLYTTYLSSTILYSLIYLVFTTKILNNRRQNYSFICNAYYVIYR
jgi:hypothetical protein